MSTFQRDMTQGSVVSHLVRFSLPFLAANLLQALYNMVDMLIVGRYCGPVGTSAVGAGGTVIILVTNMISGLAVGGTVLTAQFLGARRQQDMERTVGTMFTLYAIASVIFTAVMLLMNRRILMLLNVPSEAFDEALSYLNICMGGTVFVFGYNAVSAVLRGMGNSRHPLLFVAISTVINIILDIIFVSPLGMGVSGAAWATIIAQAVSFILSVIFLRKRNFLFDFHPRSFRIQKNKAIQLLKIGLPTSLQGTLVSFSFMWLMRLANDIAGIVGLNALSITGKVNGIAILPAIAMQVSVSSMVGQNLGAGKPARARKAVFAAMALAFAFSLSVFVIVNLFSKQIMLMFLGSGNTELPLEVIEQCIISGSEYMRYFSYDYLIVCFSFCINGLAMGAGQTLFSLFNAMASALLLRVPVAWLLGVHFDLKLVGVGLAAPIAGLGSLLIGIVYFISGSWRKSSIKAIKASPADG
ncbi:MAG: MATE family efflux transporter [Oscillospiraceae bacterium]|nr:MATE family efflux transporter [Oscillospiraceae bacterium]